MILEILFGTKKKSSWTKKSTFYSPDIPGSDAVSFTFGVTKLPIQLVEVDRC